MPDVYHDPNGRVFLMTKGKEKVSVAQDQHGNVFMFDRNGNLYYDTGDKSFGMLVVTREGDMFNMFTDSDNQTVRVPLGKIDDLVTFNVDRLGGIPVDQLQRAFKGDVKQITAFPSDDGIPLPPNAPATITEDGMVTPPPILEEGSVLLNEKRSWLPFAGQLKDEGGTFKPGGPGYQKD